MNKEILDSLKQMGFINMHGTLSGVDYRKRKYLSNGRTLDISIKDVFTFSYMIVIVTIPTLDVDDYQQSTQLVRQVYSYQGGRSQTAAGLKNTISIALDKAMDLISGVAGGIAEIKMTGM